ncbi:MAG: DNA-binding protein [Crocinitomicaceae bacterium]|jgi:phage regulator Rha-like protein|nr:DNA-binding protein [Crocinitomicaceae bacterium]
MTKPLILPDQLIIEKIHFIRNQKVMLDRDLADLFDVKPIRLREQLKRNLSRFPSHFMFQLNDDEANFLVAQNIIPSKHYYGGTMPYVFTEHGILQLSNILRSDKAIAISIQIIDVFIQMREILLTDKNLLTELDKIKQTIHGHEERMDLMYNYLMEFGKEQKIERTRIGYKKQQLNS